MGIAVYFDNQVHERSLLDPEIASNFSVLMECAPPDGHLSEIGQYGDTMFNFIQLNRLAEEIRQIGEARPDLQTQVSALLKAIETVQRNRGYLWFEGD